jgi:hypothetical protein
MDKKAPTILVSYFPTIFYDKTPPRKNALKSQKKHPITAESPAKADPIQIGTRRPLPACPPIPTSNRPPI